MSKVSFSICHRIPGRMRLRVRGLRLQQGCKKQLSQSLGRILGVTQVQVNATCASVVVYHRRDQTPSIEQIHQALVSANQAPSRWTLRQLLVSPTLKECRLCQLKLRLMRTFFTDAWRCWLQKPFQGERI